MRLKGANIVAAGNARGAVQVCPTCRDGQPPLCSSSVTFSHSDSPKEPPVLILVRPFKASLFCMITEGVALGYDVIAFPANRGVRFTMTGRRVAIGEKIRTDQPGRVGCRWCSMLYPSK